jgi:DNA modification methylase
MHPEPVPSTVLDPFAGSGTTLAVALELGRRAIGVDCSSEYLRLAQQRIGHVRKKYPLFGEAP